MYRKPLTIRVSVVKKGLKKVTAATIAESLSSSPYEVGSDFKFPFCIIGKIDRFLFCFYSCIFNV